MKLPTRKETLIVTCGVALFFLSTGLFIGLRFEHFALMALFLALFFASTITRKLAIALLPFMVFAIHNWKAMDFLSGIFYLCWVPVPILFGVYLYLKGERELYLKTALVFLFVNLIGFVGYYVHPAAPPWYVMLHGFEPVLNTPGETAGLARFDAVTGLNIFSSIYSRNANVFAAVPSLHSAYMVIPLYYSIVRKSHPALIALFAIILVGIWFTAVYSGHHYIIDVLLGIGCAILGIFLFEKVLLKWNAFRRFFEQYSRYIQ